MSNHKKDARSEAFDLFKTGISLRAIAAAVGVSEKTLSVWKRKHGWIQQLSAPPTWPVAYPVPANMPDWVVGLVALLTAQQQQLQRIETLLARQVPPA